MAVRTRAGLFDVSHMGEIEIAGADALKAVQHITSNDASRLAMNQIQSSALTTPQGTFVDDVLVYKMRDDHFMLVVNASNIIKDFQWIAERVKEVGGDAAAVNTSSRYALLALQGPAAMGVLQSLTGVDLSAMKYYWFATGEVASVRVTISRTGYTGEDGFELYFPNENAAAVWNAILAGGEVTPAGLGARDSLRLEMGMALYGNDIDDTVTPLEANLGWLVKLKKGDFVGRDALVAQKEQGIPRKLVGFTLGDRNIARHGYPVFYDAAPSGLVCSGTMSPTLGIPIGTCYLPTGAAKEGTTFEVEIRGKRVPATVVKTPFYKDASHL
jgi:aminomethyltransferase